MSVTTHNREGRGRLSNGKERNPDRAVQAPVFRSVSESSTSTVTAEPSDIATMTDVATMTQESSLSNVRPGEPTDEQLLAEYREGDRDSFAKLMARYQRELYHFLVRFLGDRAAAEDVFQEAFLQVHQSADQFDLQRRFRPWLFTIAANKARDLIRSQARRPTNPLQASINSSDDDSGEFIDLMQANAQLPDEPMQREELQESVKKMVMGMPDHLREILLLSYFHQFPYKQIGDILDIPLGTVKSRLHAAVAHFADRWRATNHAQLVA